MFAITCHNQHEYTRDQIVFLLLSLVETYAHKHTHVRIYQHTNLPLYNYSQYTDKQQQQLV